MSTTPAVKLLAACFLLLSSLLPACGGPAAPATRPVSDAGLAAADPCATRLHDICGAMLMYYLVNHQLPADLNQLRPFAETGSTLNFNCPVSSKPYIYVPLTPDVAVTDRRLVLYDAVPVHQSLRWAIVAEPAQAPTQPVTLWVVQVDEKTLRGLLGPPPVLP